MANLAPMARKLSTLAFLLPLVAACASPSATEVTVLDFSKASGAYILVYSTDQPLRASFEDQLVADLGARNIKGYPSHPDLPDVKTTNRENVLAAATAQKAMFIVVVEEVPHGQTGVVRSNEERITHEHPTLHDFYEHTLPADHGHDEDSEVFVEVSAFLIQEDHAKLFWSGTTWGLQAEGGEDRIAGLSATIADAIERARRQYLNRGN